MVKRLRCPAGSLVEEQVTVKKFKFSRRESLGEKIEAALTEAEVSAGGLYCPCFTRQRRHLATYYLLRVC